LITKIGYKKPQFARLFSREIWLVNRSERKRARERTPRYYANETYRLVTMETWRDMAVMTYQYAQRTVMWRIVLNYSRFWKQFMRKSIHQIIRRFITFHKIFD
jgi:hypothetical protein